MGSFREVDHHALPDGFADTLNNMAARADQLADHACLTSREQRIQRDLADRLRRMARFPAA